MLKLDNRTLAPVREYQSGTRSLTTRFNIMPGQRLECHIVKFSYIGPARELIVGFALKPKTGFFGTDWNNGLNTIPDARAFSPIIGVPNSPVLTEYEFSFVNGKLPFTFGFNMITPGKYALEGGGEGTINEGDADTWVWIADVSLIYSKILAPNPQLLMAELNMLKRFNTDGSLIDTDAAVVSIQKAAVATVASGSGLQVGYRSV